MIALEAGPIPDLTPVRLMIDLPAEVHRDLAAYAELHAAATGQASAGPGRIVVAMLVQFMASHREFAERRRQPG